MFDFISEQFEMSRMGSSRDFQSFSFSDLPGKGYQSSCHVPSQASVQPSSESITSQIAYQKLLIKKVNKLRHPHALLVVGCRRGECANGCNLYSGNFQNLPKLKAHIPCVPAITFLGLYLTDLVTCFKMVYELVIQSISVCNSK